MLKAISKRINGFSSTIEITSSGFLYIRPGKKPILFHTFIGAHSYDKFIRMAHS